jgi:hypothetical protein
MNCSDDHFSGVSVPPDAGVQSSWHPSRQSGTLMTHGLEFNVNNTSLFLSELPELIRFGRAAIVGAAIKNVSESQSCDD